MKNKLLILLALVVMVMQGGVNAQNGFNMPYSQYGIGETNIPLNMPFAAAMGGVAYTQTGYNFINPFNPASYAAINMESFVFDMGLNLQMCNLKNNASSQYDADGNISHLAVAFPLAKWWKTSVGLIPYATMSYNSTRNDSVLGGNLKTIYFGDGGVSEIYWGNAFSIGKRFSVGMNVNYLFGTLTREIVYDFQGSDTTYMVDSYRHKESVLRNFFLDLGLLYTQPLNNKYSLRLGMVCKPARETSVNDKGLVVTALRDTIFPCDGQNNEYVSTLEQPFTFGVGLALERNELWQLATDFTCAPWNGMKYIENTQYNLFGSSAISYGNYSRINVGFEYKGDKGASKYFNRIGFRVGTYYEQGKLRLNLNSQDHCLNELGMGAGISLPMRKGQSVLNISFNYAHYGNASLLLRNSFTIGLSVGSCESWFVKRKYN